MNKFFIVLKHTYLSKLKSKSFIITTAVMIGIIYLLANLMNIIEFFDDSEAEEKVLVIAESDDLFAAYQEQMAALGSELSFESFTEADEAKAEDLVTEGEAIGLLEISLTEEDLPNAIFKAPTVSDSMLLMELEHGLQQLKTGIAAAQVNLTSDQLDKIFESVSFEAVALSEEAKTAEELSEARGLVYVLLFIIYITVIMYASMIATEVATEKASRVMEILVSSVPPIVQMFGKILGIALLGLTQLVAILLFGYWAIKQNLQSMDEGFFSYMGFSNISVTTIVFAVVFFLLGYMLYAVLAALLGSLVSRIEDVNQMVAPMTFLIIIGFLIAMFGLEKPDATFITITSYIPFFTPMIMFLRIGMLSIPAWEIALGIAVLLATIVLLGLFGARVYRGGVLMYGKSSSFKDIAKALRLTKDE